MSYYFCEMVHNRNYITKEQGDSFVVYYNENSITLIDQIHATNLIFKKSVKQSGEYYDVYQRKEGDFNYTAKVYANHLKIKLIRYNKLDGINLPETTFECTKGINNLK